MKLTIIVHVEFTDSPHRSLNTVRGVLSEVNLVDSTNDEILEGLQPAGSVALKRIMFCRDGKEYSTKHVVVIFERHTQLSTVKEGVFVLSCSTLRGQSPVLLQVPKVWPRVVKLPWV